MCVRLGPCLLRKTNSKDMPFYSGWHEIERHHLGMCSTKMGSSCGWSSVFFIFFRYRSQYSKLLSKLQLFCVRIAHFSNPCTRSALHHIRFSSNYSFFQLFTRFRKAYSYSQISTHKSKNSGAMQYPYLSGTNKTHLDVYTAQS